MSYIRRIRNRDGRIPDLIYRAYKAVQHVNIPPIPAVHRLLASERGIRHSSLGWIKRKLYDEPIFRLSCVECGRGLNLQGGIPQVLGELEIHIGEHVIIHGNTTTFGGAKVFDHPRLVIGNRTHCGARLGVMVGADVTIGSDVLISNDVGIFSYDSHPLDPEERRRNRPAAPETSRPVRIEDNVWICAGTLIMKGVTIGENSVIAAGSVVVEDVPANVVVAGNPARIVRRFDRHGDRKTLGGAQRG